MGFLDANKIKEFVKHNCIRIVNWIIIFILIYTVFNVNEWNHKRKVISWDIISYYAYLPATFIYHDLSLDFKDNYKGDKEFIVWPIKTPNGKKIIKTSMGLSFLYAPFFFMGHIVAKCFNYNTGGYSAPYKFFLIMSTIVYFAIGLYFLRKILEKYFSPLVIIITTIAISLGTNLFRYGTLAAPMPHAYNFSLFIIFIYLTIKWHKKPGIKNSMLIGLIFGIISLIRPSNVVIILVFVFYDVNRFKDLAKKFNLFFKESFYKILIMVLMVVIVWLPQLIYWKYITGSWLFNSYIDEKFYFNHPHIIKGLLGFRKGWLIYTPVMIFAIIGIPLLWKKYKFFFLPVTLFLILNIYIVLSWWCWWYGGSLGQRAFIDSYGLLAIPLATFISYFIKNKNKIIKYSGIIILYFFIVLGIFHNIQYRYGAIHYDSMTRKAYFDSFGRIRPSKRFYNLLQQPDYESARKGLKEKPIKTENK